MPRPDDTGLTLLLSAAYACLIGCGAVADFDVVIEGGWNRRPDHLTSFKIDIDPPQRLNIPPQRLNISVATNSETKVNADAMRETLLGRAANQAKVDAMQTKVDEYERGDVIRGLRDAIAVDRRELANVQHELRTARLRIRELEAAAATADDAATGRIRQLESQLAAARDQVNTTPPTPTGGDDTSVRYSMMELD